MTGLSCRVPHSFYRSNPFATLKPADVLPRCRSGMLLQTFMSKLIAGLAFLVGTTAGPQQYTLGPDSQRHESIPRGTLQKFSWTSQGGMYPGMARDYWVYVPAQYSAAKPACLIVVQDGAGAVNESGDWRYPIVLDNLIAQGSIPVTIGVFG